MSQHRSPTGRARASHQITATSRVHPHERTTVSVETWPPFDEAANASVFRICQPGLSSSRELGDDVGSRPAPRLKSGCISTRYYQKCRTSCQFPFSRFTTTGGNARDIRAEGALESRRPGRVFVLPFRNVPLLKSPPPAICPLHLGFCGVPGPDLVQSRCTSLTFDGYSLPVWCVLMRGVIWSA